MFPLSQQIFLPDNSAVVAISAVTGDHKTDARTAPMPN